MLSAHFMIVILSLLLISASFIGENNLLWMQQWSSAFHQTCLQFVPQKSDFPEIYQAMVCGKNLPQNLEFKFYLSQTSLIHLIVVSGSHLLFLSQILRKTFEILKKPKWSEPIIGIVLFLFLLSTAWQAPAVRAFVSVLLGILSRKKFLFWSSTENSLYSLLLCLVLFPQWIQSLSLLLSTCCALALGMIENFSNKKDPLNEFKMNIRRSIGVYFVLLIPLAPICIQSPLGIVFNIIFSPFLGLILFPLCLLSSLSDFFVGLTDLFLHIFAWCLKTSFQFASSEQTPSPWIVSIYWIWLYALFIHYLAIHSNQRGRI